MAGSARIGPASRTVPTGGGPLPLAAVAAGRAAAMAAASTEAAMMTEILILFMSRVLLTRGMSWTCLCWRRGCIRRYGEARGRGGNHRGAGAARPCRAGGVADQRNAPVRPLVRADLAGGVEVEVRRSACRLLLFLEPGLRGTFFRPPLLGCLALQPGGDLALFGQVLLPGTFLRALARQLRLLARGVHLSE